MIHRICVEHLAPRELGRPEVVRLLVERGVAPMLAVRPGGDAEAMAALAPYIEAGLPACAWPLLDDEEGYWPSAANVEAAVRRVEAMVPYAERVGLPWVALDFEPPLARVLEMRERPSWRGAAHLAGEAVGRRGRAAFAAGEQEYAALHKKLLRRNIRTQAIAFPAVAVDFGGGGGTAMQRLCAAPLRCGWDGVALLAYGSMLAGWSRGWLDVADARWYLYRALGRVARALGTRAGAYVGIVGAGKLGDEPAYAEPAELAVDAAAARAAGVGEVSLFCLEGVLGSRRPEAWLDALVRSGTRAPEFRRRGELLHRSIQAAAAILPR